MALGRKKLFVVVEEFENESRGDVDLVETQVGADEANAEVEETNEDVSDLSASIEEAMEDIDTLEEVSDTIEESADEGVGMGLEAAKITTILLNSISDRLGMQRKTSVIPSLESFGSSNSRVHASRVAVEGIKEWAKEVWEAIKRAVAQIIEKVKSFASNLLNNAEKIKKQLEAKKKEVAGLKDFVKAEDKLKNKSIAHAFSKGKAANQSTAEEIIGKTAELLPALKTSIATVDQNLKTLAGSVKANQGVENIEANIKNIASSVAAFSKSSGDTVYLNSKYLKFGAEQEVESGVGSYVAKFNAFLVFDTKEDNQADEIEALDQAGMSSVLDKAIKLCDTVKAYKDGMTVILASLNGSKNLADDVIAAASKIQDKESDDASETKKTFETLRKVVTSLNTMVTRAAVPVPGLAFSTIKAAEQYVSASMTNKKKAEAAK